MVGEAQLKIECNDQTIRDTVVIARGGLSPLFGRNWLKHIRLDWNSLFAVRATIKNDPILDEFPRVFSDGLGRIAGHVAKLHLRE